MKLIKPQITLFVSINLEDLPSRDFLIFNLWYSRLYEGKFFEKIFNFNEIEIKGNEECKSVIFFFISLLTVLFERANIPIFSNVNVLESSYDNFSRVINIKIGVPKIELIAENFIFNIVEIAKKLTEWVYKKNPNNNLTDFFDLIHSELLNNPNRIVPIGKSTIPLLKVSDSMGIPFIHLGSGLFQIGWGKNSCVFDRSSSEDDSFFGAKLSHNKYLSTLLMSQVGLPIPSNILVKTYEEADLAASKLGFPVVVKPNDGDRGEGVSVEIKDTCELKKAFYKARDISKSHQVLVEKQAVGICHRLFIVDYELLYSVKRLPISITGDGEKNISQLVSAEVEKQKFLAPWARSKIKSIDEDAISALGKYGYSPYSIPKKNELVGLRLIESTADGGVDEEVTSTIHSDNISIAILCCKIFKLKTAGIDIISYDITRPWYETGAVINEINFAPLLGGGEISRSYIAKFLQKFIKGDGRIPIDCFYNKQKANLQKTMFIQKGINCFSIIEDEIFDQLGNVVFQNAKISTLSDRINSLLKNPNVGAIVIYSKSFKS